MWLDFTDKCLPDIVAELMNSGADFAISTASDTKQRIIKIPVGNLVLKIFVGNEQYPHTLVRLEDNWI